MRDITRITLATWLRVRGRVRVRARARVRDRVRARVRVRVRVPACSARESASSCCSAAWARLG